MEKSEEIKLLLQKAIDTLNTSKCFEERAMMIAMKLGLQGEKRRMRYESAKNHNLINFFLCDTFDTCGLVLTKEHQPISTPIINSMQEYFTALLNKTEELHAVLHDVANKMVIAGYKHGANYLYEKCCCLIEDIKYFRRIIREGTATLWSAEFIFLHQTTEHNIHDCFEAKEKEVGYNY